MKWTRIVTSLIVLLGIALSIEHFFDAHHYNPGFYEFPVTISFHVAFGGMYLGFAALQFVAAIRNRMPGLHRLIGRLAICSGLVASVTAVAATIFFPYSGQAMIYFVAPFAGYFGFALIQGYRCVRTRDFEHHRQWMIRAFAIASAIATQRLILVPTLYVLGTEQDTIRMVSMFSFTSAFVLHALVSEYWLYRARLQFE